MLERRPIAIIDIGSNSVRLVVYSAATRVPSVVFNEKVMAGLGKGLNETGALTPESRQRTLAALARFRLLMEQMGVKRHRVVATAAVRDASNGEAFLCDIRALGLEPEVLSGAQEAFMAGCGVISSIPGADGIVGDLGGGSLELVDIRNGEVRHAASLPLGVLRLAPLAATGGFRREIVESLERTGFVGRGEGRDFYMVGGSWRTLARFDMALLGHPLPITHQHVMAPDRPQFLLRALPALDKARVATIPFLAASRVSQLPVATRLLRALAIALKPRRLVTSSFGIREGLLYSDLSEEARAEDPLIAAARAAGTGLGRFEPHGELLDKWIGRVFDDTPEAARIRLAACLLADVAWQAHPDYRAERGLDMALHGNWVGIDAAGRVMLAQALFCSFGGGNDLPEATMSTLCSPAELKRASQWGLAMRLGQRLSGGVAAGLERTRLRIEGDRLRLELREEDAPLVGEAVERRFRTLAQSLGFAPEKAFV